MPAALTYPGVYVEEIPSGVHTIIGVATSVTAFVGAAAKGPVNEAVDITSWADFDRQFGGLWANSTLGFAVLDFFINGGSHAVIVRLFAATTQDERDKSAAAAKAVTDAANGENTGKAAKTKANAALSNLTNDTPPYAVAAAGRANAVIAALDDAADKTAITAAVANATTAAQLPVDSRTMTVGTLTFNAMSPGKWGGYLRILVSAATGAGAQAMATKLGVATADLFNLTVTDLAPGGASESYLNLTVKDTPNRVDRVLADSSSLIAWGGGDLDTSVPALPDFTTVFGDTIGAAYAKMLVDQKTNSDPTKDPLKADIDAYAKAQSDALASVGDGDPPGLSDYLPNNGTGGIYCLEQLFARDGIFNLLVIPPYIANSNGGDVDASLIAAAAAYCETRRAMLLVDAPTAWTTIQSAVDKFPTDGVGSRSRNAAAFFPRLTLPNPLSNNQLQPFSAGGTVAGIFARTDTQRGVWKAPAGIDASLVGVSALTVPMTNDQNGQLNPLGLNCLRKFPIYGHVVWGSRTLKGADAFADEYKYIPVRRTALYIEESLYRGTQWVVFEPNDEPLWASIRLNVGAFMHGLFRQGAFQGSTPKDAYFVKCDKDTTTQNDIDAGIVNILVGFAPLKPAEFVVIQLQQIAGQIQV